MNNNNLRPLRFWSLILIVNSVGLLLLGNIWPNESTGWGWVGIVVGVAFLIWARPRYRRSR